MNVCKYLQRLCEFDAKVKTMEGFFNGFFRKFVFGEIDYQIFCRRDLMIEKFLLFGVSTNFE